MTSGAAVAVLVVEDERIVGRDIQYSLRELGYDAYALASSADEAVKHCEARRPDIVLMDIRIRGAEDGIEAARRLRDTFDVPVVFLTAHADEATVERARRAEPYGYLLKPLHIAEVRSAIEVGIYKHANERRQRAADRMYSSALHSMIDPVICVDQGGAITFMNAAAETLTGVDRVRAVGFPLDEVVKRSTAADPRTAELVNAETGAVRVVREAAATVTDEGRATGTVLVFRDITQEKMEQRQLEIARRLDALATTVCGVAHEVNNPLAVITVNSSFVQEELANHLEHLALKGITLDSTETQRLLDLKRLATDIRTAASTMAKVVSDLWTFSLPAMPRRSSRCEVGRAASWAVRATRTAFDGRAEVVLDIPEGLVAAADDHQLGQVFVNLLTNAAHSIAPGDVRENFVRVRASAANARVRIEVSDTGCGIPDELQARIFDPFFSTKPDGVGRGLGLAVVSGIVSAAGGTIRVTSKPGVGTTFALDLPAPGNDVAT